MGSQNSPTRAELVFIPAPFTGHIISTVELVKLLVSRNRGRRLSATILTFTLPSMDPTAAAYTASLAPSPGIRFLNLPQSKTPPPSANASSSISAALVALISNQKPLIRDAVARLVSDINESSPDDPPRLAGFVIDMFCTSMLDIAAELRLPTYLYYTSGASMLGLSLHIQALHDRNGGGSLIDIVGPDEVAVPAFSEPVPVVRLMPFSAADPDEMARFVNRVRRFRETKGILVNSIAELEPRAFGSLAEGCGGEIPAVYPVGPVLDLGGGASPGKSGDRTDEIVAWLDGQPDSSVVFLCFGSMGSFDGEQVQEIAAGLERTGSRFLWSLRKPPAEGKIQPGEYASPEEALPKGFLDRTKGTGKVIGWAPQVTVLSHRAVGGFVSHCGWNSVLESLWFGVPIATWPMYAEQQFNAMVMARELGLAAEITLDYKKDLRSGKASFVVRAEDVERGIKCLMGDSSGMMKEKVRVMREKSRKALKEGGSSYASIEQFIAEVVKNMPHDQEW